MKLVGEPEKNVNEAIRAEHCDVREGFGASATELTAGNYGVTFTPAKEYINGVKLILPLMTLFIGIFLVWFSSKMSKIGVLN